MTRTLTTSSPWTKGRLDDLAAAFAERLTQGFATADFDGQPEPETLQCRDETDQIRWIGLVIKCQAAIALGAGDAPIDPPIRCTSNREYAVSHADAAARMMALMGQYAAVLKNLWALKDQIGAARDLEDLRRVDVEGGWP